MLQRLLVGLVLLLVVACQESPDPATRYVEFVGLALGLDIVAAAGATLPEFPKRGERRIELSPMRIDAADFVRFHRCDMGGLIGERNSTQVRLGDALERLGYELRWLKQAERCAADAEQRQWLAPYIDAKRERLAAVIYNAMFDQELMSLSMGATEIDGSAQPATDRHRLATAAWRQLADALRTLSGSDSLDEGVSVRAHVRDLRYALRDLALQFRMGHRRTQWQQIRVALTSITQALTARGGTLCLSGKATPRVRRLVQVFRHYYVPWQARFAPALAADAEWLERWRFVLSSLPTHEHVLSWSQVVSGGNGSEWARTQEALRTHALAWERLLSGCGLGVQELAVGGG